MKSLRTVITVFDAAGFLHFIDAALMEGASLRSQGVDVRFVRAI